MEKDVIVRAILETMLGMAIGTMLLCLIYSMP